MIQFNYMKKKIVLAITILLVLIITYLLQHNPYTTNTFAMRVVTDSGSSGGDRVATADLYYRDSILTTGIATYIAHPRTGGELNYTCKYTDEKWVSISDESTGITNENEYSVGCLFLQKYPRTVESVRAQIKNKELLPMGFRCGHGDSCYSITK